jgi:branched-chain amino acid transport system ATP-binding protein
MNNQAILHVQEVTKAFGGVIAVNGVDLEVNEGEIFGIIGPNGSGKTTLINCITGFIKMTSGKVLFRGKDISGKPAHKIADMGITRTFQIMRP